MVMPNLEKEKLHMVILLVSIPNFLIAIILENVNVSTITKIH